MWHAFHLLASLAVEIQPQDRLVFDCAGSQCNTEVAAGSVLAAFLPALTQKEVVWIVPGASTQETASSGDSTDKRRDASAIRVSPHTQHGPLKISYLTTPEQRRCFHGAQWGVQHVTLFGRDKGSWRGIKTAFVRKVNEAWKMTRQAKDSGFPSKAAADKEALVERKSIDTKDEDQDEVDVEHMMTLRTELESQWTSQDAATNPCLERKYIRGGVHLLLPRTMPSTSTSSTSREKHRGRNIPFRIVLALRLVATTRRITNLAPLLSALSCIRQQTSEQDHDDGEAITDARPTSPYGQNVLSDLEIVAVDLSLVGSLQVQHSIVRDADVFTGAHGQALSWLPFAHRVIELMPHMSSLSRELCRPGWDATPMYAYGGLGLLFGVPHLCVVGSDPSEDSSKAKKALTFFEEVNTWIRENVTVPVHEVTASIEEIFQHSTKPTKGLEFDASIAKPTTTETENEGDLLSSSNIIGNHPKTSKPSKARRKVKVSSVYGQQQVHRTNQIEQEL
ncbi:unnamed protein product [Amoebophrya sp. A25]|nr:unnamed protein product [Amoebophrya sp. A25]|eukprot:GSA25T00018523001.1